LDQKIATAVAMQGTHEMLMTLFGITIITVILLLVIGLAARAMLGP
jgi:hypothetical protein